MGETWEAHDQPNTIKFVSTETELAQIAVSTGRHVSAIRIQAVVRMWLVYRNYKKAGPVIFGELDGVLNEKDSTYKSTKR